MRISSIRKIDEDDQLWQKLDALAKSYEGQLADALEKLLVGLHHAVDVEALIKALEAGDIAAAEQLLATPIAGGEATDVLRDNVTAAGRFEAAAVAGAMAAGGGVPPGDPWAPKAVEFRFDSLDPKLVNFLRTYELTLIKEISDSTREAVRAVLLRGMHSGLNPRDTARNLKQIIGLTEHQANAVINFRSQLDTFHLRRSAKGWNLGGKISRAPGGAQVFEQQNGQPLDQIRERRLRDFRYDKQLARALETGKPLKPEQIDKMVEAYARKYRRLRSETIARSETMRATNAGILQTWQQAIDKGAVAESLLRKRWIIAKDERTCPICQPMPRLNAGAEGEGIPLKQPFKTGSGGLLMTPIAHPSCRCTMFIRLLEPYMLNKG